MAELSVQRAQMLVLVSVLVLCGVVATDSTV